jgi:hypothetical protein
MKMATRTLKYLHLYPIVDQKHMKMIDAKYSLIMGYWASRNNMQEYKVYAIVIRMFELDFVNNLLQASKDNLWPIEPTNRNYMTYLLHQAKYLIGMSRRNQYSLIEASHKKWPNNESDPDDDKYELPLLKYDENQEA